MLLDEPTAGMSNSETEQAVALIRKVTESKTLVMVEHDMGVVFSLADRISVLVYGQIIASDTPERIRENPGRARSLSRAGRFVMGAPLLEVAGLEAYYGKSHILHGVTFYVGEGEIVGLLGRNGVGRSTTIKAIMGDVPPLDSICFRGEEIAGLRPHQTARKGLGYVPETRDIFPGLTVRQNLQLGEEGGQDRRPLGDGGHVSHVPAARGARRHAGGRPFRRRAADADDLPDADGRPGPRHDRRADGGPLADDGGACWVPARGDRQDGGVANSADPAEADDRAEDRASAVCHGSWEDRLPGHRGGTRRGAMDIRKEWLEV